MNASLLKNLGLFLFGVTATFLAGWMLMKPPRQDSESPQRPLTPSTLENDKVLVDFDLLKETYPDDEYLPVYPEALSKLDQTTVTIRGFMTPYDSLEDLETFMIMSFPTGCNFCAPPSVDQVVLVRQVPRSQPYSYLDGPIEVTGTLKLWSKDSTDPAHKDEYFLYIMTDVQVASIPPDQFKLPENHLLHNMPQP